MKRIILFGACGALLLGGLWVAFRRGERPDRLLARGNQYFDQQKFADASLNYRKALQADPKFAEAYYRLGLAELRLQHPAQASAALSRAADLLPRNEDVQARLGDLYLLNYEANHSAAAYAGMTSIARNLLALNPNSFSGLRLSGYLAVADGKPGAAIDFFTKANAVQPLAADVVTALVQSLLLEGREAEAIRDAQSLQAAHPDFGPIYDTLYGYYQRKGQTADAERILLAKLDKNPTSAFTVAQLAEHYWRHNQPAQADRTIQQLVESPKSFSKPYRTASDYYWQTGRPDEAVRALDAGSAAEPKERLTHQKRVVETLLQAGKAADALARLNNLVAQFPADDDLRGTRATLLVDSARPEDRNLALTELEGIVQRAPNSLTANYQLGRAFAAAGKYGEARHSFEIVAVRDRSHFLARLGLAEVASKTADFPACLRWVEEALALKPDAPSARLLRATALVGVGRANDARTEYLRLIREYPKYREAKLQMALLNVVQGRYDDAEKGFRDNYEPSHGDFRALKGLIEMYYAQGRPDLAFAELKKDISQNPNSQDLFAIEAGLAARSGQWDRAAEAYSRLSAQYPENAGYLMASGEAYRHLGDFSKAAAAFSKAQVLSPNDWRPPFLLGYAYQSASRSQDAITAYRQCLRLNPDHPEALNNLAFLLAEQGHELDEALLLAKKASELNRGSAQVSDTMGWIYLKQGHLDAAQEIFTGLIKKNPQDAMLRYHLGLALHQKGERLQARRELQAAVQSGLPHSEQSIATQLLSQY